MGTQKEMRGKKVPLTTKKKEKNGGGSARVLHPSEIERSLISPPLWGGTGGEIRKKEESGLTVGGRGSD